MFLTDSMRALANHLRTVLDETGRISHSGTKGGIRESRVRRLLSERIPRQFAVVSGVVVNKESSQSLQQDFLIADSLAARPFVEEDAVGVFPIEIIAGCLEVKSRIERPEIRDGVQKAASLKALMPIVKRTRIADIGDGVVAPMWNNNKPFAGIIGLSTSRSYEAIQDAFVEECLQVEPENRPNALFILDTGAVFWAQESGLSLELAPQVANYSLFVTSPDLENSLMLFYGYLLKFLRSYVQPEFDVLEYIRATGVPLDHRSIPLTNYKLP